MKPSIISSILPDGIIPRSIVARPYSNAAINVASAIILMISMFATLYWDTKALAVPLIILIVILILRYRSFLIYMLLITAPFCPYYFPEFSTVYVYLLVLPIIALWLIRKFIMGNEPIQFAAPLMAFLMTFMFFTLMSALNGGITTAEQYSLIRFSILFALIIVLYDIYRIADTVKIMISITIPLLASTYFMISAYAHAGGIFEILKLYRLKPAGLFLNSNSFGAVILIVAPFWLALSIWSRKKYKRIVSGIIAAILIVALIGTNSRASMVGFLMTVILFSFWKRRIRRNLAIFAIAAAIVFSIPTARIIFSVGLRVEQGSTGRMDVWRNTVEIIKQDPWLGVGIGNFGKAYMPYFETVWHRNFFGSMSSAHNQYLSKTAELGIMGFVLMIILYYFPLRSGINALRIVKERNNQAALYGILGGIVAIYGQSIFETWVLGVGRIYPDILIWILIIMVLKIERVEEMQSDSLISFAKAAKGKS